MSSVRTKPRKSWKNAISLSPSGEMIATWPRRSGDALGTPDIQRTKDHYLQNLGMTEVERGDDGSVYLSIGYNHHDLVLRPGKEKALLHVGFHLKPHISIGDFAPDAREH